MEKAYQYRIYPNKKQKEILAKTFGCCRFVYNHYLDKRIKMYEADRETLSYERCANDRTKLKSELEWLKKELSRKAKGSSNRSKARRKVARLQESIANQRKDFLRKLLPIMMSSA